MSTPADRIRRALGFCHQRFWSQKVKAIKDAASAIAELERERDRHAEVREIITSVVCGALNRAGINEVDNPGVAIDAIRNRAENAERERDELRAKLAEYEKAPTVATVVSDSRDDYWYTLDAGKLPPIGTELIARDETIRKLRDPVAVHVAMLRGEIAVPPLAELLHVYGATFSDLDAANIELAKARETIRQLRAEASKWAKTEWEAAK